MTKPMRSVSISRRTFMQTSAASGLGMLLSLTGCNPLSQQQQAPLARSPNIVFIIPDDMGWNDVGYHGSEIKTPHIDKLARDGIRFQNQYVMPTCTPTRVGLISGRYPSRYGVTSPAYGEIFDEQTVTLPGALHQCGYQTFISGKWHMGSPPEFTPRKYGFDHSYGYFAGQIDPYTHHYKNGDPSWHRNDEPLGEEGHATDLITDEAVRVIKAKHKNPFFLYVAYSVPHYPLAEPEQWTAPYQDRIADPSRRLFAASVTHMDEGIGRIVDALDRQGLRQNTLIVFVSDNGGQKSWQSETQYQGRYADKPHTVLGDNLPLRGWKGDLYEGGIRVPALVNWPSVLAPGETKALVHIVDWMPTLCKLAGYRPDQETNWDGQNVWSAITTKDNHTESRTFYWKTPNAAAVRQGDLKLIVKKKGQTPQLFDLGADPLEETDLGQKRPQDVERLTQLLNKIARQDRTRQDIKQVL
jgi:arylsulfatase A-like enzyme